MNTPIARRLMVAALVAAGASVSAQTKPASQPSKAFEGFSISLGASQVTQSGHSLLEELYQEITVNPNSGGGSGGTDPFDNPDTYDILEDEGGRLLQSKDAFNGQIALAYNLAVGDNFLLGLEVAKQFGAGTRLSNLAIYGLETDGLGEVGLGEVIETKNNWSVALKPAYAVSSKFMVYGKVSYANAKITGASSLLLAGVHSLEEQSLSLDKSVSGLGLGLGFEYNLDDNWFLQLEIERIGFDSYRKRYSTGTRNTTLVDGSLVTDGGAQAGEYYSGTADIGVNLSKATLSLGYRF